jgi:hypothetical protein
VGGKVTITRNEAGALVVEGETEAGGAAGVAVFKDREDWLPALEYLIGRVL